MSRRRFSETALARRMLDFAGHCAECAGKVGGSAGLEWDHIIPLAMGGADEIGNLQPLCRLCHRAKTAVDKGHIAKAGRMQRRAKGIKRTAKSPLPGSRDSRWKRTVDGRTIRRDSE